MKKLLLILICLFTSFSVIGWELIRDHEESGVQHYIDKIKKKSNNNYFFWYLENQPQGHSILAKHEVNCVSEGVKMLHIYAYSKHFGSGKLIDSGIPPNANEYLHFPPESIFQRLINRVCLMN